MFKYHKSYNQVFRVDLRFLFFWISNYHYLSQLMRLCYLSHRWPAKAQVYLRMRAFSPGPSLFAYMKYGSRQRVRPNIRHLAPLADCACTFEEEFTEDEKYHNLMACLIWFLLLMWLQCSVLINRGAGCACASLPKFATSWRKFSYNCSTLS